MTVAAAVTERLRALLRLATVSSEGTTGPAGRAFDDLVAALPGLYPRAHAVLEREVLAGRTLLYRWPGVESGNPAVLMAHYAVVAASKDGWAQPPFAGEVT